MANPYDHILEFWLGAPGTHPLANAERWWKKDPAQDALIRDHFGGLHARAVAGELSKWLGTPRGRLAYIILLDQFSRNMFRDTPQAFAQDALAVQATLDGMAQHMDQRLTPVERWFFHMPLMHSEDLRLQEQSVAVFKKLATGAPVSLAPALQGAHDFALQHHKIIARFGRFPHRNAILGRTSTAEELAFLQEPGSSF